VTGRYGAGDTHPRNHWLVDLKVWWEAPPPLPSPSTWRRRGRRRRGLRAGNSRQGAQRCISGQACGSRAASPDARGTPTLNPRLIGEQEAESGPDLLGRCRDGHRRGATVIRLSWMASGGSRCRSHLRPESSIARAERRRQGQEPRYQSAAHSGSSSA
jgi:hypothetical protein